MKVLQGGGGEGMRVGGREVGQSVKRMEVGRAGGRKAGEGSEG